MGKAFIFKLAGSEVYVVALSGLFHKIKDDKCIDLHIPPGSAGLSNAQHMVPIHR